MKTKELHIAVKRGRGYQAMMEKYGFSSKEGLYAAIRHLTPEGAEVFIKGLEKNEEILQKRAASRKQVVRSESFEMVAAEEINDGVAEDTEGMLAEGVGNVARIDEMDLKMSMANLETLQKEEAEASEWLCRLEGEHKEMVTRRGEIVKSLVTVKKTVQNLQYELNRQEKKLEELCSEYNGLAIQMQRSNEEQHSCRQILEGIRARIDDLQMMYIFVYEDGNIEIENGEIVEVQDDTIDAITRELIMLKPANDLLVRQVKAMVKLREMVKVYRSKKLKFEIDFENEKEEEFFHIIDEEVSEEVA